MAVWNLGSVNIDHVYRVPHLPSAGETLSALDYSQGLGGKGANQSVAAAMAGTTCHHIGAIGPNSDWVLEELAGYGVRVAGIARLDIATGHAIINVDPGAENNIVIYPGANRALTGDMVIAAMSDARAGDTLLLQNETTAQAEAAAFAADRGMRVVYSAAPFEVPAVRAVLGHVSILVMNEIEAQQVRAALGGLPPVDCIITKGAQGAEWISPSADTLFVPAFRVTPVDTTGAGDTFIGTLAAALDLSHGREEAMRQATAASAIQVTRRGAARAIPSAEDVVAFLRDH